MSWCHSLVVRFSVSCILALSSWDLPMPSGFMSPQPFSKSRTIMGLIEISRNETKLGDYTGLSCFHLFCCDFLTRWARLLSPPVLCKLAFKLCKLAFKRLSNFMIINCHTDNCKMPHNTMTWNHFQLPKQSWLCQISGVHSDYCHQMKLCAVWYHSEMSCKDTQHGSFLT